MDKLQSLLRQYNILHKDDISVAPWNKQYCAPIFPKYWQIVFSLLKPMNRNLRILEIGCGLGDITAIPCYLGFKNILAYEKDTNICNIASRRIFELFNKTNIIQNENYPNGRKYSEDILIMVNCAYADLANTKDEYINLIREYYTSAGYPHYLIMEVIDSSYKEENPEFPKHIRLSREDVLRLFPNCKIMSWETYKYPANKKSKTLYFIERI